MPSDFETTSPLEANTAPPPDIEDRDKDALHVLPLGTIPLKTAGLQKWRLTKNARLETVVEIFSLANQGSGQISIEGLDKYFDDRRSVHDDLIVLRKLSSLSSYDVYTLRIQLRRLNIPVTTQDALRLSETKKAELVHFMRDFTRPLIQKVYGGLDAEVTDFDQLVGLFSHPNRDEALRNLQLLADRLQVGLTEIPDFLEQYGDVFLSMAYYRSIRAQMHQRLKDFATWSAEAADSFQLKKDTGFQRKCTGMLAAINSISTAVTDILNGFDTTARTFWSDIGMATFRKLRDAVTHQHALIGGLMCGLYVKLRTWGQAFQGKRVTPEKSASFILSDMIPGLEAIKGLPATLANQFSPMRPAVMLST